MNYIVFDLEASCWEKKGEHTSEIIEIGAIKINEKKECFDEFNRFVKPVINPQLSDFCKNLTSITQQNVDNAKNFPLVIQEFKDWIGLGEEDYLLCSWGFYDKKQITADSIFHQLEYEWVNKHISVKHRHSKIAKLKKPVGLSRAIYMENMKFEGIAHRGIDDAKNIAKIFLKYFGQW